MCYKQKCKVVSLNLAHPVYQLGSRDTLQSHGTKGYCDNSALFLSNLIGFGLDRREGLSPREGEICYFGQSTYF